MNVDRPSMSAVVSPASSMASRHAAAAIARVVRPDRLENSVRPIPTIAHVMVRLLREP